MHQVSDPIDAFTAVWRQVQQTAPDGFDPATTTLATVDAGGAPSARMVLLRGADGEGFSFFTNYESRKALELDNSGRAALCFFWFWLGQQVRVEGPVERVSAEESDAYFATRPRGSQIGAWASDQSRPLASRAELEARYREAEARYEGRDVPRPPHWGGYRLRPDRIEFWSEGQFRLHDRWLFTRVKGGWQRQRLYP
jgi:pyridoxamine 5'-phosphate oxidase